MGSFRKVTCPILREYWTGNGVIHTYYMASSVSGQDEPNHMLGLATQVGKMKISCPLGTTHCAPIDQACTVKMAGYWPRSFFLRVYGPRLRVSP